MATKVLISAQFKGGSGKSTIATNVAATLAMQGKKTLLVDLDPQGNVLLYFGLNPSQYKANTISEYIEDPTIDYTKCLVNKLNLKHIDSKLIENLDILPSNFLLKLHLDKDKLANKKIVVLLEKIRKSNVYDYIVIDTNPSWTILHLWLFNNCHGWLSIFEPASANFGSLEDIIASYKDQKAYDPDPNPNMKLIVVPNKVALKFRKDKETGEKKPVENFNYQYLAAAKAKIKNLRNVYISEPISKSDQIENAVAYYHMPAVLITNKLDRKPFTKIQKQFKELTNFVISKVSPEDIPAIKIETVKVEQPKVEVKVEEKVAAKKAPAKKSVKKTTKKAN